MKNAQKILTLISLLFFVVVSGCGDTDQKTADTLKKESISSKVPPQSQPTEWNSEAPSPPLDEPLSVQKPTGQNAVWVMSSWMEKFDAQRTKQLVHDLKAYNIGILYPRLSSGDEPWDMTGTPYSGWIKNIESAKQFIETMRSLAPEMKIIPWKGYRKCINWNREKWYRVIKGFAGSLAALDVDGIQFDYECGNFMEEKQLEQFGSVMREIKTRIGSEKIFSVAIPILAEKPHEYKKHPELQKTAWYPFMIDTPNPRGYYVTPAMFEIIFTHADQVVTMIYDTWFGEAQLEVYHHLVASQTWASAWFAQQHGKQFLPGIRLSVKNSKAKDKKGNHMHYHAVENPLESLKGFHMVRSKPLEDGKTTAYLVEGVAFYRLDIMYDKPFQESFQGEESIGRKYLDGLKQCSGFFHPHPER